MIIDQSRVTRPSTTFKLSIPTMCLNTTFGLAISVGQGDSWGRREQTGPSSLNKVSLTTRCKRYLFLSLLLLGVVFNLAWQPVAQPVSEIPQAVV
jgi:hypothetical protein